MKGCDVMTIMDGFKLGIGLYIAKNIGYACDGLCEGVYKGFKKSKIYNNVKLHTKEADTKKEAISDKKPMNPVGFGHIYN
mgnify:CR=1 FL=1